MRLCSGCTEAILLNSRPAPLESDRLTELLTSKEAKDEIVVLRQRVDHCDGPRIHGHCGQPTVGGAQ